jgi:hypothetical protein
MLTLNGLVGIMAQPHILASVGTGRTERACRIGMTYGNFMKRFCTIGWALVGLMVLALLSLWVWSEYFNTSQTQKVQLPLELLLQALSITSFGSLACNSSAISPSPVQTKTTPLDGYLLYTSIYGSGKSEDIS